MRKNRKEITKEIELDADRKRAADKKKRRRRKDLARAMVITMVAACFAVLFLMPIVLTITRSEEHTSELQSH